MEDPTLKSTWELSLTLGKLTESSNDKKNRAERWFSTCGLQPLWQTSISKSYLHLRFTTVEKLKL